SGRPRAFLTQASSYCSSMSPRAGMVHRPTWTPLAQRARLRLCEGRPMSPVLARCRGGRGLVARSDRQLQAERRAYPQQLADVDLGSMLLQIGDTGLAHANALGQRRLSQALRLSRGLQD